LPLLLMGAYSPVPFMTPELMDQVKSEILEPVLNGMREEGTPYHGLLYAGLMVDKGKASVVEFNVRFGDPETQPLLRVLDEDLLDLMNKAACGELPERQLRFKNAASIIVVIAAEGYPGSYKKEIPLRNLNNLPDDIICFHAGTIKVNGNYLSNGGRILGITATGENIEHAREKTYDAISDIDSPGTFYRKDIGRSVQE